MAEIRFTLRLPEELHNLIKQKADETGRSINEQVVFMLSDHARLKDSIERRIEELEADMRLVLTATGTVKDSDK